MVLLRVTRIGLYTNKYAKMHRLSLSSNCFLVPLHFLNMFDIISGPNYDYRMGYMQF